MLLFFYFIYFTVRAKDRQTEGMRTPILCFTPQVSPTAKAGPNRAQGSGTQSSLPMWVVLQETPLPASQGATISRKLGSKESQGSNSGSQTREVGVLKRYVSHYAKRLPTAVSKAM